MAKTLYLECDSGISGDMVAGALIDLGASTEGLGHVLASLPVGGFTTRIRNREANGVVGCDFLVELDAEHENHDHDMAYLYGFEDGWDGGAAGEGHGHAHGDDGHGGDGHGHAHGGDGHGHAHGGDGHAHGEGHGHGHGDDHDHERDRAGDGGTAQPPAGHDGRTRLRAQAAPAPARTDAAALADAPRDHADGHEAHAHDHDASGHHHHHHEHRGLDDVVAIVNASALSPRAKATAVRVFEILAEAEAKAHGTTRDAVHFHEVGAVDSIVDVVTAAFCLDDLGIEQCVVSPLAEGWGQVRCAHGILPIPVPAVANVVAASGLVLRQSGRRGEFVTPTGAAIAAAIRTADALPASYRVLGVGVGVGKRAYDPVSMVRAFLVEDAGEQPGTSASPGAGAVGSQEARTAGPSAATPLAETGLVKLETEVDDCTGEALAHALERLYAAGALEAHFLPCLMKKGRPGYQLEVLCRERDRSALERVVFEDTTTIGIRRTSWDRTALSRERVTLATAYGTVAAKRVTLPSGATRTYPEYASVAEAARACGVGYEDAWQAALAAARSSEEK